MQAALELVERYCLPELTAYTDCVDANPGRWQGECNERKRALSECASKQCAAAAAGLAHCTDAPAHSTTSLPRTQLCHHQREGEVQAADRAVRAVPQGQRRPPGGLHRPAQEAVRVLGGKARRAGRVGLAHASTGLRLWTARKTRGEVTEVLCWHERCTSATDGDSDSAQSALSGEREESIFALTQYHMPQVGVHTKRPCL